MSSIFSLLFEQVKSGTWGSWNINTSQKASHAAIYNENTSIINNTTL